MRVDLVGVRSDERAQIAQRPLHIARESLACRFSQARTRWIATGATVRQEADSATPPFPRSVNQSLGRSGPEYFFDGLLTSGGAQGYLETDVKTGGLVTHPVTDKSGKIKLVWQIVGGQDSGTTVRGRAAHVIQLSGVPSRRVPCAAAF